MYEQLLEPLGFKKYKSCGCGGTRHLYFRNPEVPGMDIDLMPNKSQYKIVYRNRIYRGRLSGFSNELTQLLNA